jgi:hypothetical protein
MSGLEHPVLDRLPTIQQRERAERFSRSAQDRACVRGGKDIPTVEPLRVLSAVAETGALAGVAGEGARCGSGRRRGQGEDVELAVEGLEGLEGGVGAEGGVGEVEDADGVVVVVAVGGGLFEELVGRVLVQYQYNTQHRGNLHGGWGGHTASFCFSSFSSLKFAILASRRVLGSEVEMVENVVGDSV